MCFMLVNSISPLTSSFGIIRAHSSYNSFTSPLPLGSWSEVFCEKLWWPKLGCGHHSLYNILVVCLSFTCFDFSVFNQLAEETDCKLSQSRDAARAKLCERLPYRFFIFFSRHKSKKTWCCCGRRGKPHCLYCLVEIWQLTICSD